ncbi:MAG: acyl-CoA-binding protein [Cyclobacteriaceae bacterium]|nr:acyl-CoA-binding protein [Cyclobacteriaceae bacterium]
MMHLKEAFQEAKNRIESHQVEPSNEELLQLYAYFKQATIGNNMVEEPSNLDFKAIAKFRAWKKLEGMDSESAMSRYIDLVNAIIEKKS